MSNLSIDKLGPCPPNNDRNSLLSPHLTWWRNAANLALTYSRHMDGSWCKRNSTYDENDCTCGLTALRKLIDEAGNG